MRLPSSLLLLGVAAHRVAAQFVPAPTDLISALGYANITVRYKEVPTGICELNPNVKSFTGYADVEENQHIFFWFFEARNVDPTEAPLTVWINGGPGSSSMLGLFQELGPCGVDFFGNVYNNPYSWSTVSNMLFIDQPTTVGFSYSIPVPGVKSGRVTVLPNNTCPAGTRGQCGTFSSSDVTLTANSTAAAAPNMWKTLQGFMGVFPQYSRGGFHFTSESYGGHYAPIFNEYIEQQNAADIPGATKINLKSVMIGNGWYDPLLQYQAYYNFTVFPGNTYDYDPYNDTIKEQLFDNLYGPGKCVDMIKNCSATGDNTICRTADNFCANNIEGVYDDMLNRDEDDVRELEPDPYPYNFYVAYLNTPAVQKAIGAYTNFSTSSSTVSSAFGSTGDDGREDGTVEAMRELINAGVTVAMYTGDADYNCNWLGGQAVAKEIGAFGWEDAGFVNISTSDGIVHGQVKQAGRFSFTRIYESGHEVPFYQPLASLEIFERVINGRDIATGSTIPAKCFKTIGTPESTYREGNGTIQFQVVPSSIQYNTTTNEPGAPWTAVVSPKIRSKRMFKPSWKA